MSIKVLIVTAPNLQWALSTDAALGLSIPRPTRCLTSAVARADLRPARLTLMSASLKFIAPGITASQPEFDRYLAAWLPAEACDAMQWWAANAHHYTARLAKQYLSVPATSS